MAQRVNITIESDLSGTDGAETLNFGLDGKAYEVDLTETEGNSLRKALAKYVAVARPAKNGARRKTSGPDAAKVREWAKENNMEVPDRGRIPADVKDAYAQAHKA